MIGVIAIATRNDRRVGVGARDFFVGGGTFLSARGVDRSYVERARSFVDAPTDGSNSPIVKIRGIFLCKSITAVIVTAQDGRGHVNRNPIITDQRRCTCISSRAGDNGDICCIVVSVHLALRAPCGNCNLSMYIGLFSVIFVVDGDAMCTSGSMSGWVCVLVLFVVFCLGADDGTCGIIRFRWRQRSIDTASITYCFICRALGSNT